MKFYLGTDVSKLWVDITVMCVSDHIKQPTELHIYQMGGHGFGMKKMGKSSYSMIK